MLVMTEIGGSSTDTEEMMKVLQYKEFFVRTGHGDSEMTIKGTP